MFKKKNAQLKADRWSLTAKYSLSLTGLPYYHLSYSNFPLYRAVSRFGIRPTDLSGEPARHRSVPVGTSLEALPYGYQRNNFSFDSGRCQRVQRLAHLCSFRSEIGRPGKESLCTEGLFGPDRSILRHYLRPKYYLERLLQSFSLPRTFTSYSFQRSRKRENANLSYKQHCVTSTDYRFALQESLADRAVLQVDQTAPSHKTVLWHIGKCRKNRIWVAVSMYVLIAIIKKKLNLNTSLYTLLQILSITLFEKMPLQQALQNMGERSHIIENQNQLNLFNS